MEARATGGSPEAGDLKIPEYEVLTDPVHAPRSTDFRIREVDVSAAHRRWLERVVVADRLREVRALIGFTRIESSGELDDPAAARERRAPLSRTPPKWVPATEIRGEGLFLQFHEEELAQWAGSHTDRNLEFFRAHRQWRTLRKIPSPEAGYPGLRFVLLHSFAHALIRQFAALAHFWCRPYAATGGSARSRARSSSVPPRPYIWRFSILRLICPSTGPLLQG